MKISIYQISMERDIERRAFESLERLEKFHCCSEMDSSLYDKVFEGEVDCANLEEVFRMFNLNHPEGYTGRSLSVSDIVEVVDAGISNFYFCDSIGFEEVAFQPKLTGDGTKPASLANNTYFMNIKAKGEEWEQARVERKKRKEEIVNTYGWESREYQDWCAEDKAAAFPFSDGQSKAYRAWANSLYHNSSELECADLPWEKDAADFVATLREAGFTEFVVTDQSTALMELLHTLSRLGCTLAGLCQITRRETRWGEDQSTTVNGIRFSLEAHHEII